MATYVVKCYNNGAGNAVGSEEFGMTTPGSDADQPVHPEQVQLRLLEALVCNLASIAESLDLINQALSNPTQASNTAPIDDECPF